MMVLGKEEISVMKKKFSFLSIFILLMALVFIKNVDALATREEMLTVFPESVLDSLTEEQYNKFATLDFSKAKTKTAIYEDTSYPDGLVQPNGTSWDTNYKKISISVVPYSTGSIQYAISLDLQWKYIPAVKSYDVMAMRFYNMAINGPSIIGKQSYVTSSGTAGAVGYGYLGRNMNYEDDGFGISMNIVNEQMKDLHCFIEVDGVIVSDKATVYGAYEHAVDDVSLATSKNYSISAAGMGKVINFDPTVWDHYDDMQGVSMSASK